MNLSKFLNQTAVYWAPLSIDGYGDKTYSDPIEISVRWTIKSEIVLSSKAGEDNTFEEIMAKSYILSETDVEVGGMLLHGNLLDLSSDQHPKNNGASKIVSFSKIPTKSAKQFLRKAWII